MQNSVSRKVILGVIIIVLGAAVAMFATVFLSTAAFTSTQELQERSHSLLSAANGMKVSSTSGGLQLFRYLEMGDPQFRREYQRHSDQFRLYATRFLSLANRQELQEAGNIIINDQRQLDQLSLELMSNHDQQQAVLQSVYEGLQRLNTQLHPASPAGGPGGFPVGPAAEKIAAGLFEISRWLSGISRSDENHQLIAGKMEEIRAMITTQGKPLPAKAGDGAAADFQQTFDLLNAHMTRLLQATTAARYTLENALGLQQKIASIMDTRITPNLGLSGENAKSPLSEQLITGLYTMSGMTLLLSLLALLVRRYVQRAIFVPIKQLAAGADMVAAGNLNHRVTIEADADYEYLVQKFNHMVDQLQGTTVSKALHEEQETQLRNLLDGVHDYAIFSVDDQGFVTRWNAASTRILGYETDDMEGVSFARIFKDAEYARVARDVGLLAIASTGRFETDTALVRKNGETFEANVVVTPLNTGDGGVKGYSVVVRDITERMKAERHIEQLATKDSLTGLSNRSMLMEQMHTAIARAERMQTQLVVMFIDLDHFKAVNDTLGHAAGDELLRECAHRLSACVREIDIVARLGGDEFVVLLTDVTDTAVVPPVADRMLKLLTTPYDLHGHEAQTSASIGICFYPADGLDVTALMKNADIAMYHAKELHRNNYQFYAEEMNQRMIQRLQLERELRAAVENNEFILYYQPQVVVASGEIRGAESLVRWQHPTQGLLAPTDFIAVAEDTGLILPIGEWILNEACRTIKAWQTKGAGIPYVVVNVSAAQLGEDLVTSVRQALVDHEIEPSWLMLEITETMLMERVEEAISILRRIRAMGIRIAMDDFGTGYSSLSVLQRLPLDTLKIDRSFVSAIDDESNNARAVAIIGAIIAIAKELNLSVVAEGVESPTQLAFLRTLNCDTYQGFLYSMPIDAATLEQRIAAVPVKSVLEDANGRPITMTNKVTMEIANST